MSDASRLRRDPPGFARSFEVFVALRYLRAKRKGLFALVTTSIGVAGVTVGVAALLTTLSVMNGFQTDIQKKIIGAQAHVTVYGSMSGAGREHVAAALAADPAVAAAAPFVLGQAIINSKGRSLGVVLKGLDPAKEFSVNDLGKTLREGDWKGLRSDPKVPGIVLGEELAANMNAPVGSQVVLVSPQGLSTPMGYIPQMQRFTVVGVLHTGYYEYDATTAYTSLEAAAKFFSVGAGATGFGARLKDLDMADAAGRRIQGKLGYTFVVRTYKQMNRTLFAALKLEKAVMFIILTLIILVASLNIASNLILLGVEKTRDIGLLRAMGATPAQVRRIFWTLGLLIGGAGVASGILLGLGLCYVIGHYPIVELPSDIYYLSQVPVAVELRDVAAVTLSGLFLAILATIYPATRASKVNPVEAIHYG
ncbi:MAG: ABC transporter permease [Elusimicrobia bacterium]|nr:ABC transporter permease [Elusimicrobiota bacterium]